MDMNKLNKRNMENIIKEIKSHTEMHHPNIVEFVDHLQQGNNIYILLALAEKGNLFNYMNKVELKTDMIAKIFVQMCLAVEHIHSKGYIHRDLKPENILLDENLDAVLSDFGWCSHLSDTQYRYQSAGTYEYMSPEALSGKMQGKEADVWALGVLLYELFHNKEPFPGRSSKEVLDSIKNKQVEFFSDVCEEGMDLIVKILAIDASKRPTIRSILDHPFIKKYYKKSLPSQPIYVPEPVPERVSPTRIMTKELRDIIHSPINSGARTNGFQSSKEPTSPTMIMPSPAKFSPLRPITIIRSNVPLSHTHPVLQKFVLNPEAKPQTITTNADRITGGDSPTHHMNSPFQSSSSPSNKYNPPSVFRFTDTNLPYEQTQTTIKQSDNRFRIDPTPITLQSTGQNSPQHQAYIPASTMSQDVEERLKATSSSPKKIIALKRTIHVQPAGATSLFNQYKDMNLTNPITRMADTSEKANAIRTTPIEPLRLYSTKTGSPGAPTTLPTFGPKVISK